MVTIIDVARAAGVAPSTVSYVLNGKRPISADTRRLVEQSIRQLGYRPHSRRTSAPRQRTGVIGLLAPLHSANTVPTLTRFVGSVMTAAHARDHDLLLLTHGTGMAALRRAVSTAVADALIVTDVQASDPRIPALTALGRPVVLVGEPAQSTGLSCVTLDFDAAAAGVVEHLASLGHRTVGLVGSPLSTTVWGADHARQCTRTFEATAARSGIHVRRRPCGDSADAVRSCLQALLAGESGVTALVVENEVVLPGVLEHLHALGRRVPEDISVVAVCRDETARRAPIPLTSVAVPTADLGALAVDTVLRQFEGEDEPEVRRIVPRLTVRQSSGPAPAISSCA
ncbi:LacI family DNA-binding transcriptional regulator [Kutzneria chonburiensis]|uniref:LacI family DNA-binding transcriptional regulator n=1 Tax=Kutzneria chonburiensis TaxID=1483604 RepID=A0ABV6MR71_9PSEU